MHRHQTWVLIPAYNEAQTIGAVVVDLHAQGWDQILVVDDGSTDATAAIARAHGAGLLRLPQNSGQGAALAAGMQYLRQHFSPEIIVTFDADGQHQARDIAALLAPLMRNDADVALGSRFRRDNTVMPRRRRYLLKIGVAVTRFCTGLAVTDTHNGLRALHRRAYSVIVLTEPRMGHASELLHQIAQRRLRYFEVPVTILYPRHHVSQPLMNAIPLGIKFMLLALRS